MRALLGTLVLLALSGPASAETVTYYMTGTLTHVDNGTGGSVDLSGIFPVGASFSTYVTIERSTALTSSDGIAFLYLNPGIGLAFDVGSWQCTAAGATAIGVVNDQPSPTPLDAFAYQASLLTAPAFGFISATAFSVDLTDNDGTALSSGALPRPMPDLSSWESKEFSVGFTDFSTQQQPVGFVTGTIGTLATPAKDSSWGAVKALYR
jgi:hypothetical protein